MTHKTADHDAPVSTLPLWGGTRPSSGMGTCFGTAHIWVRAGSGPIPNGTPCNCGLTLYADLSPFRLTPAELGHAGQEDARRHLPLVALDAIRDAIIACMAAGDFTTDLVRDRLSYAMREVVATVPNGIQGVLTGEFAKRGLIHRTGATVRSQRASARGRRLAVWAAT